MKGFFLFIFLGLSYIGHGQSFYYIRETGNSSYVFYFGEFNPKTCQSTDIFQINTSGFNASVRFSDIAISPFGNFYLVMTSINGVFIVKLDTAINALSVVDTLPISCNSLTCSKDNVLFAAGSGLYKYDLNTGIGTMLGPINFSPAGDLTFRDGKLYCTASFGIEEMVEVNVEQPNQSIKLFELQLPFTLSAYGVISVVESCDSTVTYITATNVNNIVAPVNTINQIYRVDFATQSLTYVCDSPGPILGAASANEFLASDCTVKIDLDKDDSSGAFGSDFQAIPRCSKTEMAICDTDVFFYSGYTIDSLLVRILPPVSDVPFEYLSTQASPTINIIGQNTATLLFQPISGTSITSANADFESVLRSIRWHNDAVLETPGPRNIEVIAFAAGGKRDTAYALLPIPTLVNAGPDTSLTICKSATGFDLSALLSPNNTVGGNWSPATNAGSTFFTPALDSSAVFYYNVSNGICPNDTAQITISVLPLPQFNLGVDTIVCAGSNLLLTAPEKVYWQDGLFSMNYTPNQTGLYWAQRLDANGCGWRDSIEVTIKQPALGQQTVNQCAGQSYLWNGQQFTTDTTLCVTLQSFNGCDSVNCLALSFYYPAILLDTTVCSGNVFNWFGKPYTNSGVYQDTVLLGACLTAGTLHLTLQSPQFMQLNASICPGDSLVMDGQIFKIPGNYRDTLQTITGCDSIVTLSLSLFTPPQPEIVGPDKFCQGNSAQIAVSKTYFAYVWSDGQTSKQIDVSSQGPITVTVSDSNGCQGLATINLSEIPPIDANWNLVDPLCNGASNGLIELQNIIGGLQPFSYQINNSLSTNDAVFMDLPAGDWKLMVTDSAGCTASFPLTLNDPPMLTLQLSAPTSLKAGESAQIQAQVDPPGNYDYTWSPTTGLSCTDCPNPMVSLQESTSYVLTVNDKNDCAATASIGIQVIPVAPALYTPTIFSPNEDGENDYFTIFGDPAIFQKIEVLRIFDRWGSLVFDGRDLPVNEEKFGWDGRQKGKWCLPGVFVFDAVVRLNNGEQIMKKGGVTVLR